MTEDLSRMPNSWWKCVVIACGTKSGNSFGSEHPTGFLIHFQANLNTSRLIVQLRLNYPPPFHPLTLVFSGVLVPTNVYPLFELVPGGLGGVLDPSKPRMGDLTGFFTFCFIFFCSDPSSFYFSFGKPRRQQPNFSSLFPCAFWVEKQILYKGNTKTGKPFQNFLWGGGNFCKQKTLFSFPSCAIRLLNESNRL